MGFLKELKGLDVYRDVPVNYTEQTVTGACISVASILCISWLLVSECLLFLTPRLETEMFVDPGSGGVKDRADNLKINFDVSVYSVPCTIIGVDAHDIMGSHQQDIGQDVRKLRIDQAGRLKKGADGKFLPPGDQGEPTDQVGEGCRLRGFIVVKKVPGNFHISAHSHINEFPVFIGTKNLNVSHTVHSLWFGENPNLHREVRTHSLTSDGEEGASTRVGSFDPLEELTAVHEEHKDLISFEYYINIVPTLYQKVSRDTMEGYQFVAHSNVQRSYSIPTIYFRYELTPITVKYTEQSKSVAHFLVQVCAIIGGVFTVWGIINNVLHASLKSLITKVELGKYR